MDSCEITYHESTMPGRILYRATCNCGWYTAEFHTKAEATKRAYTHLTLRSAYPEQVTALERLHWTSATQWRSADGVIWTINPEDQKLLPGPIISPSHAQKCINHLRGRYMYGPFTEEQDDLFESAPIIMAFRRRVAEANGVEWRDARWHDWMYEKKHGARPG